ncbi:PilZ domain-containing protein [Erythrobacter sp. SDW2]|uniref:PilZ domain-containing protein n=1 Tax=Erythrobacter sp. SDW2 TaxID=2907154 RepID=UPI001F16E3C6|nr:PilZ domain-containing protein [Erythrobacter sp. SDW2]UIP06090.1 PilZ domain-containing protein [Erythrobacter sp. SDW2]
MRSFNRFSTDEEIDIRIDGERDVATLYNLSCGGCMIELRNPAAREGTPVEVNLRDMVTAQGRVVWQIDGKCGIRFGTPVHHKFVQMLGYTSATEGFDAEDPRDRFGLPLLG